MHTLTRYAQREFCTSEGPFVRRERFLSNDFYVGPLILYVRSYHESQ
jgi:hypothetical protein